MTDKMHTTKNTKLVWLIPLLVFATLLVIMFFRLGDDTHVVPDTVLNKPLPVFSLPDLLATDTQVSNADLPAEPFILNVWGSWCPSCYTEHPFIVELANQQVNFIGVNYQDELVDALQYLEKQTNPYSRVLQDYEGKLSLDLGLTGAPESFLVDSTGHIRQHIVGVISPENWKERIQPCWQALQQAAEPNADSTPNRVITDACQ